MVQIPDRELEKLRSLLDDHDRQEISCDARLQLASELVPGSVIWVPDRLSEVKTASDGFHPFVVKDIDLYGLAARAFLRTSQNEQGRNGYLETPARVVPGLNRVGYIVVRHTYRFKVADLVAANCTVLGVLPSEYMEQLILMERNEIIRQRRFRH